METKTCNIENILDALNEYYSEASYNSSKISSLGAGTKLHQKEVDLLNVLPLDSTQRRVYTLATSASYRKLMHTMIVKNLTSSNNQLVEKVFLEAFHVESLIFLCRMVQESSPSSRLDHVLDILSKFLQHGSLKELMKDQTFVLGGPPVSNPLWDQLITMIVAIPPRVANKLSGQSKSPFDVPMYIQLLTNSILDVLHHTHLALSEGSDVSLEFMSQLLGRLSLVGYGDLAMKLLTPKLIQLSKNNILWSRILTRLIVGVPDRCLESVLKSLLSRISWYGYVKLFLGNHLHTKSTLKILMTKKFLLIKVFPQVQIIKNCIGYLADESSRHALFLQTLKNLLEVWSDGTALKHRSQEQQLNLSSAIMISIGHLNTINFSKERSAFLQLILSGVEMHIHCSTESLRNQGMIIGQHLTKIIQPDVPRIEFEYQETEETKMLELLIEVPTEPTEETTKEIQNNVKESLVITPQKADDIAPQVPEDLDSDDDFEPYDQSNDTPYVKEKQPHYIADCVEGLTDQSDPEWSLTCLQSIEQCMKSQSSAAIEIAPELAKILLHLENNFADPDFISLRFRAMVTICSLSPKPVATYLTEQFYDMNYSIRQRLDILEVIAATSQQLSGIKRKETSSLLTSSEELRESTLSNPYWKAIVQQRINANTKRITKRNPIKEIQVSENKFSDVAGYFFYPLLRHSDRQENNFDLFGHDSYLLGRLISTLGIVINSAANTMVIKNLAKTLLEFMLGLRFHIEVFVRQSLLFALCMVIINVPTHIILEEFQQEVVEYQQWLQSIVANDPDLDCQKLARQILGLLVNTVYSQT